MESQVLPLSFYDKNGGEIMTLLLVLRQRKAAFSDHIVWRKERKITEPTKAINVRNNNKQ